MGTLRLWADSFEFLPLADLVMMACGSHPDADQKTTVSSSSNSGKSKLACPSILWGVRVGTSILLIPPASDVTSHHGPMATPRPRAGGFDC